FLDEVGEMPLLAQVKLLRTLESSEVRRLGDSATRIVDVRFIAATHRDLQADAQAGRFRQDLYYRLNVVQIDLPPLRERREDIGLLASYFLERLAARAGRRGLEFSPEAAALLERYDYPGNVRELENAVEHAIAVAEGRRILPGDLPAALRAPRLLSSDVETGRAPSERLGRITHAAPRALEPMAARVAEPERDTWSLADVEREHIVRVLARHHG